MQVWTKLSEREIAALAPAGTVADTGYEGPARRKDHSRYHVKLNLSHDQHRERYRRRGFQPTRPRINAVCWHGFRDWMRAVFAADPDARIKTARADYRGNEDFEAAFQSTGDDNIGSIMEPLRYRDACDCVEEVERFLEVSHAS